MKTDKTITFDKTEIINQISEMSIEIIEDQLSGYIRGDKESIEIIEQFKDLNSLDDKKLVSLWDAFVGDHWFEKKENAGIEDVLMSYVPKGKDEIIKVWVGNRDPHIKNAEKTRWDKANSDAIFTVV